MSDGELLKMLIEECPDYEGVYEKAAARIRAECVGSYQELIRAARAYLAIMGGDGTDGDGGDEYHDLEVALSALPDQGEAGEDKPRVSDEELGRLVLETLNALLPQVMLTIDGERLLGVAIHANMRDK